MNLKKTGGVGLGGGGKSEHNKRGVKVLKYMSPLTQDALLNQQFSHLHILCSAQTPPKRAPIYWTFLPTASHFYSHK